MHVCEYETFDLGVTLKGTHFIDLTERIDGMIARAGVREGTVHVISRHTTTAVTINEMEDRLVDGEDVFPRARAAGKILFTQRPRSTTRTAGLARRGRGVARARARELSLPPVEHAHRKQREHSVSGGKTTLGTWQSCMFVELDGPRPRTVGIQVVGIK